MDKKHRPPGKQLMKARSHKNVFRGSSDDECDVTTTSQCKQAFAPTHRLFRRRSAVTFQSTYKSLNQGKAPQQRVLSCSSYEDAIGSLPSSESWTEIVGGLICHNAKCVPQSSQSSGKMQIRIRKKLEFSADVTASLFFVSCFSTASVLLKDLKL